MTDTDQRSDDDLYTVAEVARLLGFSREYVKRQIQSGRLKCVQFSSKDRRIRPSQLAAFIAEFEQQS